MSCEYKAVAAVGFRITDTDVQQLSDEDYETLMDEGTLYCTDDYWGNEYLFIEKKISIGEDDGVKSILPLYSKLTYEGHKDFINKFKHYFPNSSAQLDIYLTCKGDF